MKTTVKRDLLIFLVMSVVFIALPKTAEPADIRIEWETGEDRPLEVAPLDIAISSDGKWIFVLTSGEVIIYSGASDEIAERISIEEDFNRLAYLEKQNALLLSSGTSKKLKFIYLQFRYRIDVSELPYKGPENAPVTIVVFSDYQCQYCTRLLPLLQQVLEKYPEKVKLVFKNFPLAMHKAARKAATAAFAADAQGKFWEFHDKLFENYKALDDAKIQEIAEEVNLDLEKFSSDMKDPVIQDIITKDVKNAQEAEVSGTPSIFINGKRLKNRSLDGFSEMIESELKKVE